MPEAKTNKGGRDTMDFMNRGNRPVQPTAPSSGSNLGSLPKPIPKTPKNQQKNKLIKIGSIGFLFAIVILLTAMLASLIFVKDGRSKESSFVDTGKFQAVFLNGGQVYFGKVGEVNSRYLSLNNIYYLRVNQQVQPEQQQQQQANANDISLVKLGCELHGPEDSMVINREQVIFWENLKTDGQVAKAIDEYVKANPNGQNCQQQQQQQNSQNTDTNQNNNQTNTNNTTNRP